jgi:hypothetical protein
LRGSDQPQHQKFVKAEAAASGGTPHGFLSCLFDQGSSEQMKFSMKNLRGLPCGEAQQNVKGIAGRISSHPQAKLGK